MSKEELKVKRDSSHWPKEINGREVITTSTFQKILRINNKSFYGLMYREEAKENSMFPQRIRFGPRNYLWFRDECELFAEHREQELTELERQRSLRYVVPEGYVGYKEACIILKLSYPQMAYIKRIDKKFPASIVVGKNKYFKEDELRAYYDKHRGCIYTPAREMMHLKELEMKKNKVETRKQVTILDILKSTHKAHKKPADKPLIVDLIERSVEEINRHHKRMKRLEMD